MIKQFIEDLKMFRYIEVGELLGEYRMVYEAYKAMIQAAQEEE
jgi:hypothetical protein